MLGQLPLAQRPPGRIVFRAGPGARRAARRHPGDHLDQVPLPPARIVHRLRRQALQRRLRRYRLPGAGDELQAGIGEQPHRGAIQPGHRAGFTAQPQRVAGTQDRMPGHQLPHPQSLAPSRPNPAPGYPDRRPARHATTWRTAPAAPRADRLPRPPRPAAGAARRTPAPGRPSPQRGHTGDGGSPLASAGWPRGQRAARDPVIGPAGPPGHHGRRREHRGVRGTDPVIGPDVDQHAGAVGAADEEVRGVAPGLSDLLIQCSHIGWDATASTPGSASRAISTSRSTHDS